MTKHKFKIKCKKAIIKVLKEKYNEDYDTQDFHLVWFTKKLRKYRCAISSNLEPNQRYYECTYNDNTNELYIAIYNNELNIRLTDNKVSSKVKVKKKVGDLACDTVKCINCPLNSLNCMGTSGILRNHFEATLEEYPELEPMRPYFERKLEKEIEE